MAHEFLNDFLSRLQDAGELVRIAAEVDTGLELAAITNRVARTPGGGPALLFEKPRNSSIPIVTNLLGSRRRLSLAFGVDSLDQLPERMSKLLEAESGGWLEALKLVPSTASLTRFAPRVIKTAVCQQVVKLGRDVNLWDLPIPRCWPDEANPVITAGQVVTKDATTGTRAISRFPVQVIGQQQLAPHWHRYHPGFQHWQTAMREKRQFPVAIALGGDPLNTIATSSSLVGPAEALLFGGFLRGSGLDLVKARSIELEVPAASEIVVEGYIDYADPLAEVPSIASSTGHYLPAERLPVIQVTAISHRANPLLPVIVPGPPPSEDSWLALAIERLSLAVLRSTIPEIVDIHQPFSGAGRHQLFVSIRKSHPMQGRQILHALWGSRLMGLSRMIVVVDADVDVQDEQAVWFAVGSHANFGRDLIVGTGPTHLDDPTTEVAGVGHKLGIDATRKFPEEASYHGGPRPLISTVEMTSQLNERWNEFGLSHT
jgi:4-hydroxy-3-polyprenylbenzoate decarboxylase